MIYQPEIPSRDFFSTVLTGSRIVLKPYLEERDFDNIAALFSDPRVTAPIGLPHPNPFLSHLRDAKRARASRSYVGDWTVFIIDSNQNGEEIFSGEVGVGSWETEERIIELFSAVSADHAGHGYGREAVSRLMEHVFQEDSIATIRMQTLSTNERALSLCRKLGYRETGRRFMEAEPGLGFIGGMAVILDCRAHEFKPMKK